MRFEFCEGLFDRIEIWGVGRKATHCCACCLDRLTHTGDLVGGKIVHHDDLAGRERRRQASLTLSVRSTAASASGARRWGRARRTRPNVSTRMCRFLPLIFLPASYPCGSMHAPLFPRLSLIHISEPTRLGMISYAVFC